MPIVAVFLGITVRMFHADHPPPHFHASYGDAVGIVDIATGRLLAGHLPPRVRRLLEEWRRARRRDLMRAWLQAQLMHTVDRVKPLE